MDGFLVLSQLRNFFPQVQNIMMDQKTLLSHETEIVSRNGTMHPMPAT
ncbi:Wadjet anti-phage system protein JetD domain-containing protein [Gimesia algae]